MIRYLNIKNFATIENTQIEFEDGLNIITGETGAGKSVVIEAISLALGSRADTTFIRSGSDKAIIQMIAEFKGREYVITRQISTSGKNICRINDEVVTVGHLSMVCKKLADIHGQYDHQSLLNPDNHIHLLDLYHKDEINPLKDDVRKLYENYSALKTQLHNITAKIEKNKREHDFMSFELNELKEASLRVGEDEELEEKISVLENSEKIYENLAGAYQIASENEYSVLSALKKISDMVCETAPYSQELSELDEKLSGLYYDFEDICSSIRNARDSAVFSPQELDSCISRMETLNRLKNKHGKSIKELIAYQNELENNLSELEDSDEIQAQLKEQLSKCSFALSDSCKKLSIVRKQAAKDLEKEIIRELDQLNFSNANFYIKFTENDTFSPNGTDIAEFMISTNRGEPLKPLSRIASGGEMSRIMLAFKKITGDYDDIPTMIFDEIDSGISGITASIVGKKLHEISNNHQIICITHLPQIAAFGEHNYKIEKTSDDKMTYTTVTSLSDNEKTAEIARLLGGTNITKTTLESAKELIDASLKQKHPSI